MITEQQIMDNRKMRIFFLTGIMACFSFLLSSAQPVVKTSVDRSEILIGEQFKLTIEAGFDPEAYRVTWPVIPDSLQHFEVVNRGKMDSVYNNNRMTGLVQTLTLTSFDSGKWVLPPFLVNINPVKDDTTFNFFTDSVPVTVSFSTTDTTNTLRDIKPIREVETLNPIWYWIGAGVLLVALVIFLVWFYRYWKRNKGILPVAKTNTSPYEAAMKELAELKGTDLSDPVATKFFHTRLSAILKRYLTKSQRQNYENQTTGDILLLLRDQSLDTQMLSKAASSLRCSDAVKFAKYQPPVYESEESLQSVKEVINIIHSEIQQAKAAGEKGK